MMNIQVSRYPDPKATGWAGYIQPEDRSWIAFIGLDGRPIFFLNRDPRTGRVLSDDPTERAADLAKPPVEGPFTGATLSEEHVAQDPSIGRVDIGKPVIPLGIDGTGGVGIEPVGVGVVPARDRGKSSSGS